MLEMIQDGERNSALSLHIKTKHKDVDEVKDALEKPRER